MAEFTKTTTYKVNCPKCDSEWVVKVGKQNGQQRYLCRNCKKKFRANGKAKGRQMDAELMGGAIADFYTGRSYKLMDRTSLPRNPVPSSAGRSLGTGGR